MQADSTRGAGCAATPMSSGTGRMADWTARSSRHGGSSSSWRTASWAACPACAAVRHNAHLHPRRYSEKVLKDHRDVNLFVQGQSAMPAAPPTAAAGVYLYVFGVLINGTLFLLHLPRAPVSFQDLGSMALGGFNSVVWFIAGTQARSCNPCKHSRPGRPSTG